MNKSELINAIATDANITKSTASKALDGFIKSIGSALKKGDTITLVGFGTFYVGHRAARNGRNPKTGAIIRIQASKYPKFRAGKTLKEQI